MAAMVDMNLNMKKERWGEMEETDENDYSYLLPAKQVTGPDTNGIKTTTEYKFDDLGQKVKVTTTSRVETIMKVVSKRRSWEKFGDAVNGGGCTTVSSEEIKIDRHGKDKPEAKPEAKSKPNASNVNQNDGTIKVCRNCQQKGDHWTALCPYKDLENPNLNPTPASTAKYVPPIRAGSDPKRRRNDENSVRVTNLSEDTREADLEELFTPFGRLVRVYVAMDRSTNTSRGLGFVKFARREDAQRAIVKLNGYGYDNLILRVEWAPPKAA